jgi:glycerophosphoryl diester phosphodiesterase
MQIKFISILILSGAMTIASASDRSQFCVAHRGNSSVELENSTSSILSAADMGVGAVEFDIQHTKDRVALINHDKDLERVTIAHNHCPRDKDLSELNYAEISECKLINGETIPLFKDIVQKLKRYPIKLVIEYKSSPTLKEIELLEELYGDQPERIFFISFKEIFLDKLIEWRNQFPFLKAVKIIRLKQVSYSRTDRFDGLNTKYLGKRHVRAARKKGRIIGTFTKNSRKKIKKYLDSGVDFVTTNYPQRCMEELQRRQ